LRTCKRFSWSASAFDEEEEEEEEEEKAMVVIKVLLVVARLTSTEVEGRK
jgi:hypothetical protein